MSPGSAEELGGEFELVWSRKALARLEEIRQYVAIDKPEAAARLAIRIMSVATALKKHPSIGRPGAEPGTRELLIGGTPYIVIYKKGRKRVTVLTGWHGAQRKVHR